MAAAHGQSHGMERNKLTVTVVSAKNLLPADSNGKADPFVKVCDVPGLIGDGKKTAVVKKNLNPTWNETFHFETNYKLSCLKFQVYDWDQFSENDFMAKCYVPVAFLYGGEVEQDFPLFGKNKQGVKGPAGELRLRLKVDWKLPVAMPGTWMPLTPQQAAGVQVGLGWDFKKNVSVDLDASASMLDENNNQVDKVCYFQLTAFGGNVKHSGDNRSGVGDGDDEVITLNLAQLPANVEKIIVVVNNFNGGTLFFSKVKSAYVRLLVPGVGTAAFFRLDSSSIKQNGIFLGYFIRHNGQWWFQTIAKEVAGRDLATSLPNCIEVYKALVNPQ